MEPDTDTDTDTVMEPVVRRADEIDCEPVEAEDGLRKGVLIGAEHGARNFSIRRFELEPDTVVPKHTNAIEHEQYVLAGEFVVGIGEEEHVVRAGDALLIPAGTVHWYRNEADAPGAFLCAVPTGDDSIELVDR